MTNRNVWSSRENSQLKLNILPYLTLIETNSDNNVLLGACCLGGSYWKGSLWLFQEAEDAVKLNKSVVGIDVDTGASAAAFLPSGRQIIIADYTNKLCLMDIQKAAEDCPTHFVSSAIFRGHDDYVTCMDVDSSGTVAISGGMDDNAITWDVETSALKSKYSHAHYVKAVGLQPEQNAVFATGSQDGRSFIWDTRMSKPASKLASSLNLVAFTDLEWIDNFRGVLSDASGALTIFDVRKKGHIVRYRLSEKHGVRKLRANKSLNLLASAVDDLTVSVFDYSKGNFQKLYESRDHEDFACGLAWLNSSRTLLSCGWDTKVLSHTIPTDAADFPELVSDGCQDPSPTENWQRPGDCHHEEI